MFMAMTCQPNGTAVEVVPGSVDVSCPGVLLVACALTSLSTPGRSVETCARLLSWPLRLVGLDVDRLGRMSV